MKVAAVIYDMGEAARVDEILAAIAKRLRIDGYALAGAVQHNTDEAGRPCADMRIEDLSSGRMMDISNPKTTGTGCRLDATALEDVAGIVAGGLEGAVDLVILNRFGKQEIGGNGFRAMMENAVAREIPLLTVLNGVHRPAWDGFASGMAETLPADAGAIERWCRSVLPDKATAGT
jgi:nucleoside-triphosphatase THEP1